MIFDVRYGAPAWAGADPGGRNGGNLTTGLSVRRIKIAIAVFVFIRRSDMKRYKFQALVKPPPGADDEARAGLSSGSHRMVLRAENSETRRVQVFSALVDSDEGGPFRAGSPHIMVTLRVIGDDVGEFLEIGSHFSLWSGGDVGQGVVTRRLHL
jgi:hypothetical protein